MIGIIILNYKNWKVTEKCICSIRANPPDEEYHLVIIDNGSGNESVEKLEHRFMEDDRITIIELPENKGFAAGNNYGIEYLKKIGIRYCILSNSDILFSEGSINKLIDDVREEKTVIAGPKVLREHTQHSSRLKKGRLIDVLEIGRFFPQKKLDEDHETGKHNVFSVSGCCFAIDIELFNNMGAFDEGTFLYNEENILGMQAEKRRYKIIIDLDVFVIHEHGASSGVENDFVRTEYIKSTLYYWHKYRGKSSFTLKLILNAFITKLILQDHSEIHPRMIKKAAEDYLKEITRKKIK